MPYVKQLDVGKWGKGVAREVAIIRMTPRDLCLSHGIQFEYDEGGDGLGDLEAALLQTRSGRPYALGRYFHAPQKDSTGIVVDEKLDDVTDVLDEILCDLELRSTDLSWTDPERYRARSCRLLRIDDNGSQIEIGGYPSYPDAYFDQRKFEERGHKQTYVIEVNGSPR